MRLLRLAALTLFCAVSAVTFAALMLLVAWQFPALFAVCGWMACGGFVMMPFVALREMK